MARNHYHSYFLADTTTARIRVPVRETKPKGGYDYFIVGEETLPADNKLNEFEYQYYKRHAVAGE